MPPRTSSRLDPKVRRFPCTRLAAAVGLDLTLVLQAPSYAQAAGVKSEFPQVATFMSDDQDIMNPPNDNQQDQPWQMQKPGVATPSSWVQACAAARAEQESLTKAVDSPSEDAFIQSIIGGLDLDDDLE